MLFQILDRYAMELKHSVTTSCYYMRLGMIGEEYKAARKVLLRNLTGSSAFRNSKTESSENQSQNLNQSEEGAQDTTDKNTVSE